MGKGQQKSDPGKYVYAEANVNGEKGCKRYMPR
jgi:hypothetical protein